MEKAVRRWGGEAKYFGILIRGQFDSNNNCHIVFVKLCSRPPLLGLQQETLCLSDGQGLSKAYEKYRTKFS